MKRKLHGKHPPSATNLSDAVVDDVAHARIHPRIDGVVDERCKGDGVDEGDEGEDELAEVRTDEDLHAEIDEEEHVDDVVDDHYRVARLHVVEIRMAFAEIDDPKLREGGDGQVDDGHHHEDHEHDAVTLKSQSRLQTCFGNKYSLDISCASSSIDCIFVKIV